MLGNNQHSNRDREAQTSSAAPNGSSGEAPQNKSNLESAQPQSETTQAPPVAPPATRETPPTPKAPTTPQVDPIQYSRWLCNVLSKPINFAVAIRNFPGAHFGQPRATDTAILFATNHEQHADDISKHMRITYGNQIGTFLGSTESDFYLELEDTNIDNAGDRTVVGGYKETLNWVSGFGAPITSGITSSVGEINYKFYAVPTGKKAEDDYTSDKNALGAYWKSSADQSGLVPICEKAGFLRARSQSDEMAPSAARP